jgi:hypothetical protein
MACGIYALIFNGTSMVYIGQSRNTGHRLNMHMSLMRRGIHAKKLQYAYNLYGEPQLEILEECNETELDILETKFIEEFDSVDRGFNTCRVPGKGSGLYGEDVYTSKFSNEQIEAAFHLLVYAQELSSTEISNLTGVSKYTVDSLSSVPRDWLVKKYPEEYYILNSRVLDRFGKGKTLKEKGIVYPNIVSPSGSVYVVENTSKFAKEHKLNNGHLVQVLRGREKQHKGWKLQV